MQTLADLAAGDEFAALLKKGRDELAAAVESAGGPEAWWVANGLGPVPPGLTLEAILTETAGFWVWASERAMQCARCPAEGGACADPSEILRGQQLVWEAGPVARRCGRWREWVLRDWLRRSGVDPLFVGFRLENFRLPNPQTYATLEQFWQRALGTEGDSWLVLSGPHHSGKTHLAVALLAEVKRRRLNRACWYTSMHMLPRALKVHYRDEQQPDPLEHVRTADVVVIDHLGAKLPPWLREAIEEPLVLRWQRRQPTVITTLDSAQQLAQTFPALTGFDQKIAEIRLGPTRP